MSLEFTLKVALYVGWSKWTWYEMQCMECRPLPALVDQDSERYLWIPLLIWREPAFSALPCLALPARRISFPIRELSHWHTFYTQHCHTGILSILNTVTQAHWHKFQTHFWYIPNTTFLFQLHISITSSRLQGHTTLSHSLPLEVWCVKVSLLLVCHSWLSEQVSMSPLCHSCVVQCVTAHCTVGTVERESKQCVSVSWRPLCHSVTVDTVWHSSGGESKQCVSETTQCGTV